MIVRRAFRGLALALAVLAASPLCAAAVPERIYAFGDSYSDIGAGNPDGNGPTAIAYLAREIGLPMTYPGSPTASPASSLNFAVNAGRSDDAPGVEYKGTLMARGLGSQAKQFSDLARKHKVKFDPRSAVAFIAIGINDGQMTTEATMANIAAAVATLYKAGLRRFVIADLPVRIPAVKGVCARLNPALAILRTQLQAKYPDGRFVRSRWGGFLDQVFVSPAQYGIRNVTEPCMPRGAAAPCTDADTRFYYRPAHPSTAVHRIAGRMMAAEVRAEGW